MTSAAQGDATMFTGRGVGDVDLKRYGAGRQTTTRAVVRKSGTPRLATQQRAIDREHASFRSLRYRENDTSSGWNGSTQVAEAPVKPLVHQILCRNYSPPPPATVINRSQSHQVVKRLSKGTISSQLKAPAGTRLTHSGRDVNAQPVETDRKRHHLQHKQPQGDRTEGHSPQTKGRDAIQTLLFYRREVEKRLSADPAYFTHEQR